MSRPIPIDTDALLDGRARGDTWATLGKRFGCSHTTAHRRAAAARAYRCVDCAMMKAEIDRLREAYRLMEEALVAFVTGRT